MKRRHNQQASPQKRQKAIFYIPQEIHQEILSFLSLRSLLGTCKLVNKEWKQLIDESLPHLVKNLDLQNFCEMSDEIIETKLIPALNLAGDHTSFQPRRVTISGTVSTKSFIKLIQNNHSLRELCLRRCYLRYDIDMLNNSIANVTSLSLTNISGSSINGLFTLPMPNLRHFVMSVTFLVGGELDMLKLLPNLQTLVIRSSTWAVNIFDSLKVLFDAGYLQQLQVLDVSFIKYFDETDIAKFLEFAPPTFSKLIMLFNIDSLKHDKIISFGTDRMSIGEIVNVIGRYSSLNDQREFLPQLANITTDDINQYNIDVNVLAQAYCEHWIKDPQVMNAVLKAGLDPKIRIYSGHLLQLFVRKNVASLAVLLQYPRVRACFNFSDLIFKVVEQAPSNQHEILSTLSNVYNYQNELLLQGHQFISSLKCSNPIQLWKTLEIYIADALQYLMKTKTGLMILKLCASSNYNELLEHLIDQGYCKYIVAHIPNFTWKPRTFIENSMLFKDIIEYLFPDEYRGDKVVDPDLRPLRSSKWRNNTVDYNPKTEMLDIFMVNKGTKQTRLHYLTEQSSPSPSVIAFLIANGVDVNAVNKQGNTAMFSLLGKRNVFNALQVMILHGGHINMQHMAEHNETVICRLKDQSKLNNPIQVMLKISVDECSRDIQLLFDKHEASYTILDELIKAGADMLSMNGSSIQEYENLSEYDDESTAHHAYSLYMK